MTNTLKEGYNEIEEETFTDFLIEKYEEMEKLNIESGNRNRQFIFQLSNNTIKIMGNYSILADIVEEDNESCEYSDECIGDVIAFVEYLTDKYGATSFIENLNNDYSFLNIIDYMQGTLDELSLNDANVDMEYYEDDEE